MLQQNMITFISNETFAMTTYAFYTWASGSDIEGDLIPRSDINKLIDIDK